MTNFPYDAPSLTRESRSPFWAALNEAMTKRRARAVLLLAATPLLVVVLVKGVVAEMTLHDATRTASIAEAAAYRTTATSREGIGGVRAELTGAQLAVAQSASAQMVQTQSIGVQSIGAHTWTVRSGDTLWSIAQASPGVGGPHATFLRLQALYGQATLRVGEVITVS